MCVLILLSSNTLPRSQASLKNDKNVRAVHHYRDKVRGAEKERDEVCFLSTSFCPPCVCSHLVLFFCTFACPLLPCCPHVPGPTGVFSSLFFYLETSSLSLLLPLRSQALEKQQRDQERWKRFGLLNDELERKIRYYENYYGEVFFIFCAYVALV